MHWYPEWAQWASEIAKTPFFESRERDGVRHMGTKKTLFEAQTHTRTSKIA